MEAPPPPPAPSPTAAMSHERLPDGSYLVPAAYALTFWTWLGDLVGAPLKPCMGTKVLDTASKGPDPPIATAPPEGIGAKLGAKLKARRPNDRKWLTEAGRDALARRTNPHKKGVLWSGSVVWRL